VVLVGDQPPAFLLAKADGQAQALMRKLREVGGLAAAQKRMREGDVCARRYLQGDDLEDRAVAQPSEEWRPGLALGRKAAGAILGRRDIEHHDIGGMLREHAVEIAGLNGFRPAVDEGGDLFRIGHGNLLVASPRTIGGTPIRHGNP
jgi:hypothetical protein